MKIRTEINAIETKRRIQRINERKTGVFEEPTKLYTN
jgi:hypothetical protein